MLNKISTYFKIYGLKKIVFFALSELLRRGYWELIRNSYSQLQEDIEIDNLLNNKTKGFYVDVGANDPNRFNNTKHFYKKGWTGINIEPSFDKYMKFEKVRNRDINLNMGVASQEGKLVFFQINVDTLSTFSEEIAQNYERQGYIITDRKNIGVHRLDYIFKTYASDKMIDFITIDTEGYDMEVLKSNDWKQYRPKLICVESAFHEITEKKNEHIKIEYSNFFSSIGYKKVFNNELNSIYMDKK